jgi:hypothetical protein
VFAAVIRKRCADVLPDSLDERKLETDDPETVRQAVAHL